MWGHRACVRQLKIKMKTTTTETSIHRIFMRNDNIKAPHIATNYVHKIALKTGGVAYFCEKYILIINLANINYS